MLPGQLAHAQESPVPPQPQEEEDALTVIIPGGQTAEEVANDMEEEEISGEISQSIQEAVPDTGSETVDTAVKTMTKSIGDMIEGFVERLPQIILALLVIIATAIVASLAERAVKRIFGRMRLRRSLRDLFGQLIYIAAWFLGLMIAGSIIFPGLGVAELVATAGLLSIAVGFAFKDIFENFFAGILILWRFPFEVDDFIEIKSEDIMGRVEDIWIRMTLIRLTTGELVIVPNSTVYKSPIRILTNHAHRRISIECGVAYGEDVGEARDVIRKAVKSCRTVEQAKGVQIFLKGFGESSMDFEVTWWTGATPLDQRISRDEVVEAVKRALDNAGIEIPYPYRVLTFTKNEPLIYEKLGRLPRHSQPEGDSND